MFGRHHERSSYMKKIWLVTFYFFSTLMGTLDGFAQERVIKPGDTIEIIVYGHQELSRVVTISAQGTIDFPFVQNIPVDGLTLEKMRELLVVQLARYLESRPIVTVRFVQSQTIQVQVLGMVANPGTQQLPLHSRMQGAIGQAGGALPGAKLESINLLRSDNGTQRQGTFSLDRFLLTGELEQNPVLQDGDIIILTGNPIAGQLKVLGAVQKPGMYTPEFGATLLDMLFMAGGMNQEADLKKIRYITMGGQKSYEIKINLEDYFVSPQNFKMPIVKPGDIIFVPQKGKGILSSVLPTVQQLLVIGQFVYYYYLIQKIKD